MKKKIILILTSAILSIGVISFALISGRDETNYVKAKDEPYTLNLSSLSASNNTLTTSNGNNVTFEVSGYSDGLFSNNSYIKNTSPISGIESLTITFETSSANLTISYGWYSDNYYSTDGVINSSSNTYYFDEQGPSYFKIENKSGDQINVTSIQLSYSCSETAAPAAYSNVKYTLSSDGQYYSASKLNNSITSAIILPEFNGKPVTSIGNQAFENCSSLISVVIPNSISSIGAAAFFGCSSLTSITIPNGVKTISSISFYNCSSLISLVIPDSVTYIASGAFSGCSSLESITLPFVGRSASSTSASSSTLFGFIFGTSSYAGGIATEQGNSSIGFTTYYIPSTLKSVTITGGKIFSSAFFNCSSLTSAAIFSNVTYVGDYAFYGCSSITIYCEAESQPSGWSPSWNSDNRPVVWGYKGFVEESGYSYLLCDVGGIKTAKVVDFDEDIVDFNPPNVINGYTVNDIDFSIFRHPSHKTIIRSVVLPYGVTSIGYSAFNGCSELVSISIPNSVTSIGDGAFSYCSSLISLDIPNSVVSIGVSFQNCPSLTSVFVPSSVSTISGNAFYNCSSLTIYCEAESKPSGWNNGWNHDNRPVAWGYTPE